MEAIFVLPQVPPETSELFLFFPQVPPGTSTPQSHHGSYFCSSPSSPQGLRLPRTITEAIFVLPSSSPKDFDSPGPLRSYFCSSPSSPRDFDSPGPSRSYFCSSPSTPRDAQIFYNRLPRDSPKGCGCTRINHTLPKNFKGSVYHGRESTVHGPPESESPGILEE
jgi:hypothetical protein